MHYYLSRGHDTSGCFDLDDLKYSILAEMRDGFSELVERREFSKLSTLVNLMDQLLDWSGWDGLYLSIGDRTWDIMQCSSYGCKVNGGSW